MSETKLLLLGTEGEPALVDTIEGAIHLAGHSTPETIDPTEIADIARAQNVIIRFESSADGRGFSLARYLRLRLGYEGALYAMGDFIPDQVSMLLDCGCDGVLLNAAQRERYGEENWRVSQSGSDSLGYWSNRFAGENRAWSRRAVTTARPVQF